MLVEHRGRLMTSGSCFDGGVSVCQSTLQFKLRTRSDGTAETGSNERQMHIILLLLHMLSTVIANHEAVVM